MSDRKMFFLSVKPYVSMNKVKLLNTPQTVNYGLTIRSSSYVFILFYITKI